MLDGGLGTELIRAGFDIKDHPLWSARVLVDHPEAIKNIHKSFLLSGADVLITATYQASIEHLVQHCRLDESKALDAIQKAVKLAHEACNEIGRNWKQCFVAGSIGAYGACQSDRSEYNGKYVDNMSLKDLVDWHRPRMKALLDAGVDILALETIPAQVFCVNVLNFLSTTKTHTIQPPSNYIDSQSETYQQQPHSLTQKEVIL